jgi:2-aminoadipate transaminase
MTVPFRLSTRATQTHDQPISYFMQQAVENPDLISLAAGLVDPCSLPAAEVREVLDELLADPVAAQSALQYGTTHGYAPLRDKILDRAMSLDRTTAAGVSLSADDVIVTTGSQQLLYMVGELLLDPGDIVIAEAPSYFVYHGTLTSLGVRTLQVPMDEEGMDTAALEDLLVRLEKTGDLERVKLIYTIDYFQNPTGLTLSMPRRRHLMDLVRRFSKRQRIFVLEDAAYRELRFDGIDVPSIKSLDEDNAHVILAMTFSKPMAPGLKTGYGLLPTELVTPLLRFKGNHDFGSCNLAQHLLDRVLASGAYLRHVEHLSHVYRLKRDTILAALAEEFAGAEGMKWTRPDGGMYVWLTSAVATGPDSLFMKASLAEGVLYVPGQFCYVNGENGKLPKNEARLCFGVASHDQLREAVRRLGRAAAACSVAGAACVS